MMDVPRKPRKPILVADAGKKVLIVGDHDCGKTRLVSAIANEQFSSSHNIPPEYVINMTVKGILDTYRVCDTDGKKFEMRLCLYYVKWTIRK